MYGVKDVKRLLEKSPESKSYLQKDIAYQIESTPMVSESIETQRKNSKDKSRKCRDYLKAENFIISMNSPWKTVFDTSILLVIGYSVFTSVFFVSFNVQRSRLFRIIDSGVTTVFFIDFFFNFFQEYQDKVTYTKIRDHK